MDIALPITTEFARSNAEDLILRAKQRDATAWSELYSQNYSPVYKYLYGKLGSKEQAEDLAAQVFLEALQNIDNYREMGRPIIAWFVGIARNLAKTAIRKSNRTPQAAVSDSQSEVPSSFPDPAPLGVESLDLAKCLESLTAEQREVISLRFFADLTAREVGSVLGKTEQSVYALQVRAVASLRRAMAKP